MILQQQDGQPPKQMEGGESFFSRQRRLRGQSRAEMAGRPQGTGVQTAVPTPVDSVAAPDKVAAPQASGGANLSDYANKAGNGSPNIADAIMGTPVTGDGKIPPPTPIPQAAPPAPAGPPVDRVATPASGPSTTGEVNFGAGAQPLPQVAPPGQTPVNFGGGAQPLPQVGNPQAAPPAGGLQPMDLGQGSGATYQATHFNPTAPQAYTPDQLGADPYATYQGAKFNTATPDGYTAGAAPAAYKADQFSQFASPDQSRLAGGQADLAQAILGHPESMDAQTVLGMKNANKETALMQAKQDAIRASSAAAGRGMAGGGGDVANERRIYDNADSNILAGNRSIDAQAATTNFGNRVQALGAVDSTLNSQMGRATQGFGATLAGQSAQAGANLNQAHSALDVAGLAEANKQAEANSRLATAGFTRQGEQATADEAYRGYGSQLAAQTAGTQRQIAQAGINQAGASSRLANANFGLQAQGQQADENYRAFDSSHTAEQDAVNRKISQFGINSAISDAGRADRGLDLQGRNLDLQTRTAANDAARQDKSLALQRELGVGGLGLDSRRLDSSNNQFDKNYGLDIARYLEQQRQANNGLAYNYDALGANGQQSQMDQILRMLGK